NSGTHSMFYVYMSFEGNGTWICELLRTAAFERNSIIFGQGRLHTNCNYNAANDISCVPFEIYGIKGVQ
ncbi:MAG: hypothetical protein RRZ42_08590, partial [Oscillospiraceae bacterium]